jgi:hypothetical protein
LLRLLLAGLLLLLLLLLRVLQAGARVMRPGSPASHLRHRAVLVIRLTPLLLCGRMLLGLLLRLRSKQRQGLHTT